MTICLRRVRQNRKPVWLIVRVFEGEKDKTQRGQAIRGDGGKRVTPEIIVMPPVIHNAVCKKEMNGQAALSGLRKR